MAIVCCGAANLWRQVIQVVGQSMRPAGSAGSTRVRNQADGSPLFTPLVGIRLMVFFALAMQCISTLAVLKRETHGYKWPAFVLVYMTVLAWVSSFVVYQGGRLLGI